MGSTEVPTESADGVRFKAIKLVSSAIVPCTMATLARLNVFEALAAAGDGAQLTAEEIVARALPGETINVSYVARMLRAVSGWEVLHEVVTVADDGAVERRYAMEPVARFLVEDAEHGSFLHLLLMFHHPGGIIRTWENVHDSIFDDTISPFARTHGMDSWEYGKQNPQYDELFNKAMAGHSKVYMKAILDVYHGFEDVKVLVDVGGGFGSSLSLITPKYPHIKGINFDQPHVIDACPELPGVEHVSGNMFESVPLGGDAIFMKFILHDWDDESSLKILKNCYSALPANGKVIVVDHVLPEVINSEGIDHLGFEVDLHMLAYNSSGARERTLAELVKLGMAVGFKHVKLICKVDSLSVIEYHKA